MTTPPRPLEGCAARHPFVLSIREGAFGVCRFKQPIRRMVHLMVVQFSLSEHRFTCTKSAHPGALAAIEEVCNAEDIDKARVPIKAFEID